MKRWIAEVKTLLILTPTSETILKLQKSIDWATINSLEMLTVGRVPCNILQVDMGIGISYIMA